MTRDAAEIARLRYKYRKLILEGEVRLPLGEALKLIGPDCAYHLYSSPHRASERKDRGTEDVKSTPPG
jgi:hypothetical protein